MQRSYQRYQDTGLTEHRAMALHAQVVMQELIKGRSAEQIARMEAEKGLA